jgi:thiamine biosynthesis lipoprotein
VRFIEARFSRFLPDSLVSTLNTKRTLTTTDEDLFTLIKLGQEFYTATGGVFNCLLGEHLEAKGYDAQYSFTPKSAPTTFPNPLTDIIIEDETISLTQGKLDLGGYGKGWAIDQVAELLRQEGLTEFLINAGGDMYGTSEHGQPITIYLEHPLTQGTYIGSTTILHQGFAASSPYKRQWKHDGKTYTHIIDTIQREERIPKVITDAVFVKAKKAVVADAFATTGLLMTPDTLLEIAFDHQLGLAFFNHTENSLFSNQAFNNSADEVS